VELMRLQRQRMTSRQFVVATLTLLVATQLVAGRHLVSSGRTEETGAPCRLLVRPPSWLAPVKRSTAEGKIRRLWLSRGSTSALMNEQLRELLDSTDNVDLLTERNRDGQDMS